MTDYLIRGKSLTHRVLAIGSGEGEWHADNGCSEVVLPGATGDTYIVWASAEPSVTGNGTLSSELFAGGMWILTFTGAGPVTLGSASILAHRADLIYSECG